MIDELRKQALRARRAMSETERATASEIIVERLLRSHEFHAAKSIACFLPMPDEVDATEVIRRAWRAKKRIFSPVTETGRQLSFRLLAPETPLQKNSFGLWEPASDVSIAARDLDLVITPLVAFDRKMNRIGMGGGYFDRAFAFLRHRNYWLKPKLLGVAFDCQEVEKIAPNPWDIRLYGVITEAKPGRKYA